MQESEAILAEAQKIVKYLLWVFGVAPGYLRRYNISKMIAYLIIAGLTSLIFGILFLLAPDKFWQSVAGMFNKPVIYVESGLRSYHFPVGFLFLILGSWLIFLVLADPYFWYFHLLGIAFVITGLLYIFAPDWLLWLSNASGKEIITFDQIAIASRVSLGIVLILVSIYIFLKLSIAVGIIR